MAKKHEIILFCPECHGTGQDFGCENCKNTGRIKYKFVWNMKPIYEEKQRK